MFAECMDNRAQSASRYLALKKKLHHDFAGNQADIYTLNVHDLTRIWVADHLDRGWTELQISQKFRDLLGDRTLEFTQTGFEILDEYGATAITIGLEAKGLVALGADMRKSGNLLGTYRTSVHNGRQYIIFKGNHRLRTTLRGTRYRLNNPTIVKLGIGTEGLRTAAKGGVYVTALVSAGVNSLAWIFDESFGWREFLANVSEDVVKAALAAVVGYFAGKALAATTGMVVFSKLVGFGVGVLVGFGLNAVKQQDIQQFAEDMATGYERSAVALSDPKALMRYGIQRTEDVLACGVSVTGSLVIETLEGAASARLEQLLRRFSPVGLR